MSERSFHIELGPCTDLTAAEEEAGSGHKKNWTNDDQGSHLNNSFADADSWSDADARWLG